MLQAIEAGQCKIRVYNAAYSPGPAGAALLRDGPTLNQYDHHFTQRTIKVVFDGALGSRGAALLAPYSDAPETSGYLTQKESELQPIFEEALRTGIQIETHAIGDRANRVILDLYENAMKAVPPDQRKIPEPRWRVEHAQILTAQDLPRFAKLGVIASMQPSHAISDLFFAPSRLGKERLAGAYAWQSLLKSGAIICGGSDAPVERGEQMIGKVNRQGTALPLRKPGMKTALRSPSTASAPKPLPAGCSYARMAFCTFPLASTSNVTAATPGPVRTWPGYQIPSNFGLPV